MPILEANSAAQERVWQAKVEVKEKKHLAFVAQQKQEYKTPDRLVKMSLNCNKTCVLWSPSCFGM
jgi:hypothetical protein